MGACAKFNVPYGAPASATTGGAAAHHDATALPRTLMAVPNT